MACCLCCFVFVCVAFICLCGLCVMSCAMLYDLSMSCGCVRLFVQLCLCGSCDLLNGVEWFVLGVSVFVWAWG